MRKYEQNLSEHKLSFYACSSAHCFNFNHVAVEMFKASDGHIKGDNLDINK